MSNRLIIDEHRVAPSSHVRVSLTSCLVSSLLQPRVIPRQFVILSRPPRGQSHKLVILIPSVRQIQEMSLELCCHWPPSLPQTVLVASDDELTACFQSNLILRGTQGLNKIKAWLRKNVWIPGVVKMGKELIKSWDACLIVIPEFSRQLLQCQHYL